MQHYHRRTLGFSRAKAHALTHQHIKQIHLLLATGFLILIGIAFITG